MKATFLNGVLQRNEPSILLLIGPMAEFCTKELLLKLLTDVQRASIVRKIGKRALVFVLNLFNSDARDVEPGCQMTVTDFALAASGRV